MLLRNHGTLAVGGNVGECFIKLYFLERACQAQIMALSAGDKLNNPPQGTPELAAEQGGVGLKMAAKCWPGRRCCGRRTGSTRASRLELFRIAPRFLSKSPRRG